jgi:hypothetical protein
MGGGVRDSPEAGVEEEQPMMFAPDLTRTWSDAVQELHDDLKFRVPLPTWFNIAISPFWMLLLFLCAILHALISVAWLVGIIAIWIAQFAVAVVMLIPDEIAYKHRMRKALARENAANQEMEQL